MMRSIALYIAVAVAGACGGGDDDHAGDDGGDAPVDDAAPGDHDAAPGDGDGGPLAGCDEYCSRLAAACTEQMRQYIDAETCLATCALFPPGEPGDEGGNSLACRMVHVERAEGDPDPHCYHAGPSGGRGSGVCGAPCENYCMIMMSACPAEFASAEDCMTACADYPDPRPYTIFESRTDTVACRIYHGTRATTDDNHCGTASPDSTTCTD